MRSKKIKKYFDFVNESSLSYDRDNMAKTAVEYISRKTNLEFYKYHEVFHVDKGGELLEGILYLSSDTKALRFNWKEGDIKFGIHSIDLWNNFSFDTNPDWTLELNGLSIVSNLASILEFFLSPESLSKETDELELVEEDKEFDGSEGRLRTEQGEWRIKAKKAKEEKSETDSTEQSISEEDGDLDLDVFQTMYLYTKEIINKKSNSLVITGMAGIGKTTTIREAFDDAGLKKDVDYYESTGSITAAGLYEFLFVHNDQLLVFDDCDSVFKDENSVNYLKGALDTQPKRVISKHQRSGSFDSTGMTIDQMMDKYKETNKLPNRFEFTGRVIFISNLKEEVFDEALISRSLHVDVNIPKEQVIMRMANILPKLVPDATLNEKYEVLDYLVYLTDNYPSKFKLNIRSLVHAINLRVGNDTKMLVKGKEVSVWKALVKNLIVKK